MGSGSIASKGGIFIGSGFCTNGKVRGIYNDFNVLVSFDVSFVGSIAITCARGNTACFVVEATVLTPEGWAGPLQWVKSKWLGPQLHHLPAELLIGMRVPVTASVAISFSCFPSCSPTAAGWNLSLMQPILDYASSTPTNWLKLISVHTIYSTPIRLSGAAPGTAFPLRDATFVFLNCMYGNAVLWNIWLYPYVPKLAHEREAWQLWQYLNSILLLPEVTDTQSALFRLSLQVNIFLCSCPNKVSRIGERESSLQQQRNCEHFCRKSTPVFSAPCRLDRRAFFWIFFSTQSTIG